GIQDVQGIDGWAYTSSAVLWSTPRKARELDTIQKGQKRLPRAVLQLATAQHEIQLLQAQVNDSTKGKKKAVKVDPNTKFATTSNIRQSQIEAGEVEVDTAESSASDCPSEAERCIVVATMPSR
ncbi:transposase, partial [Colletotrichum incanum]